MCVVMINTIERAKEFALITNNFEVDTFLKSGRYVVDAKSIMGIFSLDLIKPLELIFGNEPEDSPRVLDYKEKLKDYIKIGRE